MPADPGHGPSGSPQTPSHTDHEPRTHEPRTAAIGRYVPTDPSTPMIGIPDLEVDSPIFDSISAWFASTPLPASERSAVVDLRDDSRSRETAQVPAQPAAHGTPEGRWATLGDQEWLAANARAAAGPTVAGNTESGLPRRQPGANLLPSAAEAAPPARIAPDRDPEMATSTTPTVRTRPDAEVVRGRLGSYQRGLASARHDRHPPGTPGTPGNTTTRPPLGESESRPQDAGHQPADQGGDH